MQQEVVLAILAKEPSHGYQLRGFGRRPAPGGHRAPAAGGPALAGGLRGQVAPAWWLIGVVLGTVIAVAALASIPARIGARRPVAGILQSEAG